MYPQNIKVTVDALVFSDEPAERRLLLIKRKNGPNKGMWAFPGGFVEDDEDLDTAVKRELAEETGVKLQAMTQLHTFGKVGRDPRGRTISVAYTAFVKYQDHPATGSDDAAEASWIKITDIDALAFDHKAILDFALKKIKRPI